MSLIKCLSLWQLVFITSHCLFSKYCKGFFEYWEYLLYFVVSFNIIRDRSPRLLL